MNKKEYPVAHIIGLNSGTSVDSIDVALVEFHEPEQDIINFKLLDYQEFPFDSDLRQKIFDACASKCSIAEVCELNFWLGEVFGRAASELIQRNKAIQVDLVASHGQTIYHQMADGRRRSTLQLGDAAGIAEYSGVSVASNFRVADVEAGGQGAPLVSYFDYLFFQDDQKSRAILNIGGIANITYLPSGMQGGGVYAFDTGPGNMLIDYAAKHYSKGQLAYDKDGDLAKAGRVIPELMAELMAHSYLQEKPPKSTGREQFGDFFARELIQKCEQQGIAPEDVVATLSAFTVQSIAKAHRKFGPSKGIKELVVSGGGMYNPVLMDGLIEVFPGVTVRGHNEFGISASSKEAVTFALLGYELLRGRAANLPISTGASGPRILGQLTPGKNYVDLLQNFTRFMQPQDITNKQNGSDKDKVWQPTRKLILSK